VKKRLQMQLIVIAPFCICMSCSGHSGPHGTFTGPVSLSFLLEPKMRLLNSCILINRHRSFLVNKLTKRLYPHSSPVAVQCRVYISDVKLQPFMQLPCIAITVETADAIGVKHCYGPRLLFRKDLKICSVQVNFSWRVGYLVR